MPTINGKTVSAIPGLYIKSRNKIHDAVVLLDNVNTAPTTTTGKYYLYVDAGVLKFNDGSSTVSLTGASSGAIPSWETVFVNDATFSITSGTWTVSQSSANPIFTLNKTNVGAGAVIDITNSGSGADITANSAAWYISTSGGVGILELGSTGSINATDGALTIGKTGTATTLLGTLTVAEALTFTSGGITVTSGDLTLSSGNVVLTLGNLTATDGLFAWTSTSNAAASASVINNTATTYGAAAASGVLEVRSTSLTTGTLVHLELTEGTLNGGYYLRAWDVTGGGAVFSIGEDGNMVVAGTNATTAAITLTAGKLLMSDGNVGITSSDTTDIVSVTANSLLANNALIVKGSGAFTGTTSSSFVAITPTGLSTGTALYIAAAAATTASVLADFTTSTTTGSVLRLVGTGVMVDGADTGVLTMVANSATTAGATSGRALVSLTANALTTGTGIGVFSSSLDLSSGALLFLNHTASGTLSTAKTVSIAGIISSRTHTAATAISDDYDAFSIDRTSVVNNAGGTLNAAGSVLKLSNTATQTDGTMADTTNGLEVVMSGGAEAAGYGVSITHSGTTVGRALSVAASQTTGTVALITANDLTTTGVGLSIASTGTGMTSGSLLRVSSGTTSAVATNGVVSFFATGNYTSTAATDGFVRINANSSLAGTVLAVNGNAFTTGVGVYVGDTGTGMTSGSLIRAVSGTTGAVATNGVVSFQATGNFTSVSGAGFLSVIANSTTSGVIASISGTAVTDGVILALSATEATLTTGKYIQCFDGAADDFSVSKYGATVIAGNASGTAALTLTAGDLAISSGRFSVSGLATLTAGIDAKVIFAGTETINAGGTSTALSLSKTVHYIDADAGGDIFTLADGTVGQIMTILLTSSTGVATITPTNLAGGTSVTLNADGDTVVLQFMDTEWFILGGNSYAVI